MLLYYLILSNVKTGLVAALWQLEHHNIPRQWLALQTVTNMKTVFSCLLVTVEAKCSTIISPYLVISHCLLILETVCRCILLYTVGHR
jgi:hypothetical protein